jgi:hypothetical protein
MKIFMKHKRHQDLYGDLSLHLPKLFNFSDAGIMFFDEVATTLYSIRCSDYQNTLLKDENLMRYPLNMGLTGIACEKREPLISLEGENDPKYSFEVDNINQLLDFENILIMPLIDSQGKLKGVI